MYRLLLEIAMKPLPLTSIKNCAFMKQVFAFILFTILLVSCKKDHELTFVTHQINQNNCNTCPNVEIVVPKAIDQNKIANKINTAVEREVAKRINFGTTDLASGYQKAIKEFNKEYANLKKEFPDDTIAWEATIDGVISYKSDNVISIKINSYIFTGGAHGNSFTTFLNFDAKSGALLSTDDLINNLDAFTAFAEKQFRKQEQIPLDGSINATGFMFPDDAFVLPEAVGFTERGLALIYNQYEIASYADGQISLLLPYNTVASYLKHK